ncbi:MAG TPA: nitroreductase family protein [Anaerolineaceae bacterium]|jgi:nitroreductase|nr:nitroreductase family protein [Anaerolineaceae bacterium]
MDLDEAIKGRRSIRRYSERDIDEETLEQIIQAGMWAPTACNDQDYRFIIINDKNKFDELLAYGAATFIKDVHTAILVLYKNTSANQEYKDYFQSGSAVIQTMLLKAHSLGLGSCWVCNLPSQKNMRHIFNIPANYSTIALVSMGYPLSPPKPVQRKHKINDVVCLNAFGFNNEENDPTIERKKYLKRFLRRVYYRLPKSAFIRRWAEKLEKKFVN